MCVVRCEYLFQRGVHYAIENPCSSLVWRYAPLKAWLFLHKNLFLGHEIGKSPDASPLQAMLQRHKAMEISVPLGAYGAPTESESKSLQLACTIRGQQIRCDPLWCYEEAGDGLHHSSLYGKAWDKVGPTAQACYGTLATKPYTLVPYWG